LSLDDHPNKVQKWENIHFMLINSPDCSICLFSWYGLLITVGCVGGDFSQTRFRWISIFRPNAPRAPQYPALLVNTNGGYS